MEKRINGHTKLYALIGSPVGHSGSPAMQNYSFEKLGLDCAYLAFDIPLEKTKDALDAFRTLHVGGFNGDDAVQDGSRTACRQTVSGGGDDRSLQYSCCGGGRHYDRT